MMLQRPSLCVSEQRAPPNNSSPTAQIPICTPGGWHVARGCPSGLVYPAEAGRSCLSHGSLLSGEWLSPVYCFLSGGMSGLGDLVYCSSDPHFLLFRRGLATSQRLDHWQSSLVLQTAKDGSRKWDSSITVSSLGSTMDAVFLWTESHPTCSG